MSKGRVGTHIDFFGISRSGNHPVIRWLLAQSGEHKFLNFCNQTMRPGARPKRYSTRKDLDCRLLSWESLPFEDVTERAGRSWDDADDHVVVCLLRDPFNLMASWLRGNTGPPDGSPPSAAANRNCVDCWKSYAKAFVDGREVGRRLVWVLYNEWCVDLRHRKGAIEAVGFRFDETAEDVMNRVATEKGGSSFDGTDFDRRAGDMMVFDRWRHFLDDSRFVSLFDAETKELSRAIFGFCPL